ncbi:COG3650 family protein [Shimia ponticola]|uniref:COG3650 family protein n=1 Tax=Shimia ponticola TaxID=2582893 RepID=UPI0011BE0629|nr:peptide-binding protein [Shimia ponticola]
MRALRAWSLCLLLASPALGDPFPALYDVTGVASNDVLNIRAEPSARSPVLDHFAPFERDVEVIGTDSSGKWARVAAGEQMGWSSLRFLARQAGQDGGFLPEQLFCHGTEPFWNLDFQADHTTVLDRLGSDSLSYEMSPLAMAANAPNTHGALGHGALGAMTLSVTRQSCNDGMSDLVFGLSATVIYEDTFGADVLSGCCSLR